MSATQGTLAVGPVENGWRRVACAGSCGRWWYFRMRLRGGRPRVRCDDCRAKRDTEMQRARRGRERRCEDCGDLLPPYPGRGPMKTCARCSARTETVTA